MAITLAQVKKYLRIDSDEEDELLESLMTTAEAYLKGAVTNFEDYYSKYDDFVSKADFAQMILVAEFYLNRDNEETKLFISRLHEINMAILYVVKKLRAVKYGLEFIHLP